MACRQLGYKTGYHTAAKATNNTVVPNFLLKKVDCTGIELSLHDCQDSEWVLSNPFYGWNRAYVYLYCTNDSEYHVLLLGEFQSISDNI